MGTRPLADDTKQAALDALQKHGSASAAYKALGLPKTTFEHHLREARKAGMAPTVEFPGFVTEGDEEEPIDELLDRIRKASDRKIKAAEARRWFPIKIHEEKPYGLLWFGDPHLGNGNQRLLDRHLTVARQDGIYGANIGDTTDNFPWTGKLARLWAETELSSKSERRLASWFMFEAGVKWLVWLLGNHDAWNGGTEFYKMLGAHHVPVIDWRAQFTIVHPNGSKVAVDAAHGRKGTSIYNPTHGTLRDAKFGEHADLFVSGHIHTFGLFRIEFPEKKTLTWLAQIAGYKSIDDFAWTKGFHPAEHGAAMLAIIDPETAKVQCWEDPEEGAEYLSWLRGRAA